MNRFQSKQVKRFLNILDETEITREQFDLMLKSKAFMDLLQFFAIEPMYTFRSSVNYSLDYKDMLKKADIAVPSEEVIEADLSRKIKQSKCYTFHILNCKRAMGRNEIHRFITKKRMYIPDAAEFFTMINFLNHDGQPIKNTIVCLGSSRISPTFQGQYLSLKYDNTAGKYAVYLDSPVESDDEFDEEKYWDKDTYFLVVDEHSEEQKEV